MEAAAQIQQLQDQLTAMAAQMAALQLQQAQATPSPGADPAPAGSSRLNVDARQLNKPDVFTGEDKKWRDWSIVFRSYATLANPDLEVLLKQAESLTDPIIMSTLSDKDRRAGRELYHILISMVRGQALDKVVNAGEFNGLEAWRLLADRYDPKLKSRTAGQLVTLLRWNFDGDVMSRLEAFEREVANYTLSTGEGISDNLKIGLVLNQLQQDGALRDHLLMNSGKLSTWKLFRDELVEIIRVRSGPVPMDVGGIKGGGGRKGGGGGGGGGAQQSKSKCYNCGIPGHQAKDCRKPPKQRQQQPQSGGGTASGGSGGKGDKGKAETRKCYKCQKTGHLAKDCRSKINGGKNVTAGDAGGSEVQAGADQPITVPGVYHFISCLDMHLCGGPSDPMACGECGIGLGEVTLECEDNTSPVRDVTSEREDKTSPDQLLAALSETSRKIRFQIDSGASLTVMKESEATDYPLVKPVRDRYIRAANGTPIKDAGDRHVHVLGPDGGAVQVVRAGATDVVNNLLSVIALEDTGHRLVIDKDERYYEHKVSGERTIIHRVKNEYFVDYNVIPYAQTRKTGNGQGHASQR